MHIGFTYDLKSDYIADGWSEEDAAEFDSEGAIASIAQALTELGHRVSRIGRARELARRLVAGERWDLVFNVCEGAWGRSREAQAPALCELFDQPYTFCDPLTAGLTLEKALAKRVVRDAGLRTPAFLVVERPEQAAECRLKLPLFVKPLAEGTGKGVDSASVVREAAALEPACRRLLERYRQPVLVEEYLPGREVTVGVVGEGDEARVIGMMELELMPTAAPDAYGYENKENWQERVRILRVEPGAFYDEAAALALASYRVLGCRDAGRVDLRADRDGRPSFMEVNPLAGLKPAHSDLPLVNDLAGRTYNELIADIVASAARRIPAQRP